MANKLIIVAGASSSGKSTFISRILYPNIRLSLPQIDFSSDLAVIFANQLRKKFDLGSQPISVIHYNTLLKAHNNPNVDNSNIADEPVFSELLNYATGVPVYLCYASDHIVRNRMLARKHVEPELNETPGKYPSKTMLAAFNHVNQRKLLIECGELLNRVTSNVNVVVSNPKRTSVLSFDEFRYGLPTDQLENKLLKESALLPSLQTYLTNSSVG